MMQELLAEGGAELLSVLGRALVAAVLTVVGAVIEMNAVSSLAAGDLLVGVWTLYMGGIALYAGLFVLGPEIVESLGGQSDATA